MNLSTSTNETEIWDTIYHYFLYDGSVSDIIINYILITLYTIVNFTPCIEFCSRRNILISLHLSVLIAIQVLCWVYLEAYGVSLVWCGQLGLLLCFIISLLLRKRRNGILIFILAFYIKIVSTLPGIGAIIYYAIRWDQLMNAFWFFKRFLLYHHCVF